MKMKAAQKVHYDSGPNMTPLVDVVMVILIFLMLTGTFTGATWYLKSNVPIDPRGAKTTEAKSDNPYPDTAKVDVRVSYAPNMAGGGQLFVGYLGDRQYTNVDAFAAALKTKRDELKSIGKTDKDIQLTIFPGGAVHFDLVCQAYQAAMKAEYTRIAMGTSG